MGGINEGLIALISTFGSEFEEETGIKLVGVMIAPSEKKGYNFSLFDVTENEFVLSLQIGKYIVYLAFESEEELDEDEYPDIVESLLNTAVPPVRGLIQKASDSGLDEPLILYDRMGPDLKEFIYDLYLKHRRGEPPYEQTESA
jgi:hypothetical protein